MIRRGVPFANRHEATSAYASILGKAQEHGDIAVMAAMAALGRADLFFLLTRLMGRKDANNNWCFDRSKEVAANPDGYLDLWAREHYKSTIITVALSIQDILNDPEITIGLFSHTRANAKVFMGQIKRELEANDVLKRCYPDVLYYNPEVESPVWSLNDGLLVKRKTNPKEMTVEAWGVVEGQPIGRHFSLQVYDDIVTPESVGTPDQIKKTTERLRLSYALGAEGGARRMIGTRYHLFDTYAELLTDGTVKPRIYAATKDGTADGEPRFLTRERLAEKRAEYGPYIYACQMLQDPKAESVQGFKKEWMCWWRNEPHMRQGMNIYILVDPAGEQKKDNDFTVMWVLGLGADGHTYTIDGLRDRLNLTQRTTKLFEFVRLYRPIVTGYEKYGMQADIEHIRSKQAEKNFHFPIISLGGNMPKNDRIRRLVPDFESGKIHFPMALPFMDATGAHRELVKEFIEEEFVPFPVCKHDDMLDCLARIKEAVLGATYPQQTFEGGALGTGMYDINSNYNPNVCEGAGHDYDPLAQYWGNV